MADPSERDLVADIFNTAMSFREGYRFMSQMVQPVKQPELTMASTAPLLTVSALTVELFLKTFHALDHGRVPKGHNLANLFRNLKAPSQIAIRKAWQLSLPSRRALYDAIEKETGQKVIRKLEHQLEASSNAFEHYRYSFESDGDNPDFLINDLPQIMVEILSKRRPDLFPWQPRPPRGSVVPGTRP